MNMTFTPRQAFYAMQIFLEDYFEQTSSDSLGALLSCMQFLEDGKTADPALWDNWMKAMGEREHITPQDGFETMQAFLQSYYRTISSNSIKNLLHDISCIENNKIERKIWDR